MSQKRQNFSLNQFETYSGPELSFENINTKSLIKKNKDISRIFENTILNKKQIGDISYFNFSNRS
jgi:hypothetical protein